MRTTASLLLVLTFVPAVLAKDKPAKPPTDKPKRTIAFLGVNTMPVGEALRAQLDLPEGVGLLIRSVVPAGPAAKAGVKTHDVLYKLDDQLLINPDQLATLVRTHKPGDKVTLTLIRKAKPVTLTVALGSRQVTPSDDLFQRLRRQIPDALRPDRSPPPDWRVPQWPRDLDRQMRERMERYFQRWSRELDRDMREKIERHLQKWRQELPPSLGGPEKTAPSRKPAKPKHPEHPQKPKAKPGHPEKPKAKPEREHGEATHFVLKTPKYTITVTGVGEEQAATVADSNGKVIHKNVPVEKWKTLPEDIQKLLKGIRIEKAHEGTRIQIKV